MCIQIKVSLAIVKTAGIPGDDKKSEGGEIDLIITKSISRFARNTVTVLKVARELKGLGVGIFLKNRRSILFQGTVR